VPAFLSTAARFYETEALRCGWSVRQLDRQVSSQFYERIALSRNKPEPAITLHSTGGLVVDEMSAMNYHIESMTVVGFRARRVGTAIGGDKVCMPKKRANSSAK
jgi:hypothetical protein